MQKDLVADQPFGCDLKDESEDPGLAVRNGCLFLP